MNKQKQRRGVNQIKKSLNLESDDSRPVENNALNEGRLGQGRSKKSSKHKRGSRKNKDGIIGGQEADKTPKSDQMARQRHIQQQEKSPLGYKTITEEEKQANRTINMDSSYGMMNERIGRDFANYRLEEQKHNDIVLSNSTLPLHFNASSDPFKEDQGSSDEDSEDEEEEEVQEERKNVRPRKEIIKLPKYDSNSLDEEDFQQYIDNPQKRKEYDKLQYEIQAKELQGIAGIQIGARAFKSYPDLDLEQEKNKKVKEVNYATVSLCYMSVTNPFRSKIMSIALNPWFDRFILFVILTNCVFLAMDKEVEWVIKYNTIIDEVFLFIYTLEMVIKIIAKGFFMRAHSYLRDPWNIMDFLVVILGWISIQLEDQNISAIRVVRILRPLRTINSMPGMSSLVSTIFNSLPSMFDILILFIFMLIMFGTIYTQLFGGHLQRRCQVVDPTIEETKTMNPDFLLLDSEGNPYFCTTDQQCIEYGKGMTEQLECIYYGNPMEGTLSFDNVLISILNIFQIITLEGWTDMMYIIRDSEQTYFYDSLFMFCLLFGAFFVLNLMIAVQFTYLDQAYEEEKKRQEEQNKGDEDEEEDSFFRDKEKYEKNSYLPSSVGGAENIQTKEKMEDCLQRMMPTCCKQMSSKIEAVVESQLFNQMIILFIIINTIFLASEHYMMPSWLHEANEIANLIFTYIFAIEMVLKLLGLGIKTYVQDNFNIFDSIIVIMSLVELAVPGESSGLSVLRAFRLLRIFKIIKSWEQLRILLTTVLNSLGAIANLWVLTMLYLFMSALLAKNFYGTELYDSDGNPSRYSFQTTSMSLITIFIILTGENWNQIMIEVIAKEQSYVPAIMFIFMMIIGHLMLLNLFLAVLLKYISDNSETRPEGNEIEFDEQEEMKRMSQLLNARKSNTLKHRLTNIIEINAAHNAQQEVSSSSQSNSYSIEEIQSDRRSNFEGGESRTALSKIVKLGAAQANNEGRPRERSSSISKRQKMEQQHEEEKQCKKNKVIRPRRGSSRFGSQQADMIKKAVQSQEKENTVKRQLSKKKTTKVIEIDDESKSLFLFSGDNSLRVFLKMVIEHGFFDGFIYHMIALNSLLLALDTPSLTDPYQNKTITLMLNIISVIFVMECVFKIIVMGFYIGKKTYLKDSWNVFDFVIVVCTIFTWILDFVFELDVGFVKAFRALRALRPLRVVSRNEGIKTLVNALIKSIPRLMNVMLIIGLFMIVFGILGVQLFKGMMSHCSDSHESILTKSDCVGNYTVEVTDQHGVVTGTQTLQREWITPRFDIFDHVFVSILTFFEISTLETWPDIMFAAIDSVDIDHVPKENNRMIVSIVFISFIFITSFFIMNLFISVIVDKFNEEIKKRQGSLNFTESQQEWVKVQRLLYHLEPKVIPIEPSNSLRLFCFNIVMSSYFEYFIMSAILINTICLCIDHYGMPESLEKILQQSNQGFVIVFTIECVLKITGYGFQYYFHVNWNKFDFAIVIMSLVALNEQLLENINFNVTVLRIIRVTRLLRMVKTSEGLRNMLKTLFMALSSILTTASLLTLILFTFTVAGMNLFGHIENGSFISKNANFRAFYVAMITLWRASTGESWNMLMHECYDGAGVIALVFWLSFQIITFFIFMNVFVAVIYDSFNSIQSSEDKEDLHSFKKKDLKAFQNTWAKFNPMGDLYMRTISLIDFFRELPPPLGYQGIMIDDAKLYHLIFCLNIPDHEGMVYYPEVMWPVFHSLSGINDYQVNNCEQVITIMRLVRFKYKDLPKKVNLEILCGNKYIPNIITAAKHIQALKIWKKWELLRDLKAQSRLQKKRSMVSAVMQPIQEEQSAGYSNSGDSEQSSEGEDSSMRASKREEPDILNNQPNGYDLQRFGTNDKADLILGRGVEISGNNETSSVEDSQSLSQTNNQQLEQPSSLEQHRMTFNPIRKSQISSGVKSRSGDNSRKSKNSSGKREENKSAAIREPFFIHEEEKIEGGKEGNGTIGQVSKKIEISNGQREEMKEQPESLRQFGPSQQKVDYQKQRTERLKELIQEKKQEKQLLVADASSNSFVTDEEFEDEHEEEKEEEKEEERDQAERPARNNIINWDDLEEEKEYDGENNEALNVQQPEIKIRNYLSFGDSNSDLKNLGGSANKLGDAGSKKDSMGLNPVNPTFGNDRNDQLGSFKAKNVRSSKLGQPVELDMIKIKERSGVNEEMHSVSSSSQIAQSQSLNVNIGYKRQSPKGSIRNPIHILQQRKNSTIKKFLTLNEQNQYNNMKEQEVKIMASFNRRRTQNQPESPNIFYNNSKNSQRTPNWQGSQDGYVQPDDDYVRLLKLLNQQNMALK